MNYKINCDQLGFTKMLKFYSLKDTVKKILKSKPPTERKYLRKYISDKIFEPPKYKEHLQFNRFT